MEYYDKKATNENLVEAFDKDLLGRKAEMVTFLRILDKVGDNYTISLDAPWGSGKTFFVKQAKLILDGLNPVISGDDDSVKSEDPRKQMAFKFDQVISGRKDWEIEQPHLAIYFDAWAYDDYEEPVLALIYNIIEQLKLSENEFDKYNIIPMIGSVIGIITGRDVKALSDTIEPKNILKDVKQRAEAHKQINEFLKKLTDEKGNRCDIFIDELDRCNPIFAVKLLERIKHYFTSDHVTFIFSTNMKELGSTIRSQYGENFDAYRYLDRFFDIRLSLHKPKDMRRYFLALGANDFKVEDLIMEDIAIDCNFSLREINHYIKAVHISNGINRNYSFANEPEKIVYQILVPIVVALKIRNANELDKFLNGDNEELFLKHAERHIDYSTIQSLEEDVDRKEDSEDIRRKVLSDVYHTLFPISNLREFGAHGKKIGRVIFEYGNLEELMATVEILSGVPDIDSI